jgi:hypothetical protein
MQFHPAFAAEYAAESKRLTSKYTAPLYLSVGEPPVDEDPRTADAFAWTVNQGRFPVTFNSRKFGPRANPRKTVRELDEMAHNFKSVELKPVDALTHEYGHVLVNHLSARQQRAFGEDLRNYLRQSAYTARTERQFFSALSQYGISDPWEAMAEAFVLFDRGADHPAARIAAKHLGKFKR